VPIEWPPAKEGDPDKCPSCGHADGRATSCLHGWHRRGPDSRRLTRLEIDAIAKAKQETDPSPPPPVDTRPWCVFVSGSRDLHWESEWLIRQELTPFVARYSTVIHGMGEGRKAYVAGCDRVVDSAAREMGFHIIAIPALWDEQQHAAGPIRNRLCTQVLLAFGKHGYRMAMLGFSTGGKGTEGALELMKRLYDREHADVLIKKVPVTP
jgi:hypothetical protein